MCGLADLERVRVPNCAMAALLLAAAADGCL